MVNTTPAASPGSDSSQTVERRVVVWVLAFTGIGAIVALATRLIFGGASVLDLVVPSVMALLLGVLAVTVRLDLLPVRTLYRVMTLLAWVYVLGDLSVSLLTAVDPAGTEAALRPLPAVAPFAYLFAFMGWGARRALVLSGSLLLIILLWSGLLVGTGAAPTPGIGAALAFYLEFTISHVVLIGLLVLFARARGQVGQAQRELAAMGLLARTDALTGVLNRRGLWEQLEREAHRSAGRDCRLAFVLLDLDHFKLVNDRYGHPAGDQVLAEFSQLLTGLVRTSDELGRWGGEEFVILMRRAAPGEALFLADRLRRAIAAHTFTGVGSLTASFGVAELGSDDSLEELIALADEALYRAKTSGRNRTCVSRKMMDAMAGGDAWVSSKRA
jgi:diguanylate cyclase (GGDEF)-like protein